jgi:hypothetical protein
MSGSSNSRSRLTGENLKRCAWCGRGTPKGASACSPPCAMALAVARKGEAGYGDGGGGQLAFWIPEHPR